MAHGYGYRSEQRLRKENQDTLGVFEFNDCQVLIVCDGMGGHVGGRQASNIAVRTIHDEIAAYQGNDMRGALRRAIESANRAIYEMARKNYRLMGMGTTCVAAVVQGDVAHVAHVGDSRCYLVRDGQIRALTRDHTMVNLFVDAELLSPEDAATHPEAHVLSRSLGVERQVEVDVAEPVPMQAGDRLLLCSDGVHGVIGTSGLGSIDWRNPQEGVDAALTNITNADGDDNATLVAFGTSISGTSAPITEAPDLSSLQEEAKAAPMQVALQPVRRPTLVPNAGGADGDVVAMEELGEDGTPVVHAGQHGGRHASPTYNPDTGAPPPQAQGGQGKGSRRRLLLVGGVLAVIVGIIGTVLLLPNGSDDGRPAASADAGTQAAVAPEAAPSAAAEPVAAAAADPGNAAPPRNAMQPPPSTADDDILLAGASARGMNRSRCLDCTGSFALPTSAAYLSGNNDPAVAVAFFAPDIKNAPRRVPNTASVYDHPPPSGPEQTKAVRAARNKRCREALDTVQMATQKSIDFASLYGAAWYCFNDTHTKALANARASTWEDFRPLIAHYEGERRIPASLLLPGEAFEAAGADADADEASAEAPVDAEPTAETPEAGDEVAAADARADAGTQMPDIWQLPAAGGVEYRLTLFELDGDVQGFRDIMLDLLGGPTVADHLADDVLLEAHAAAAVSRMEDPPPQAVQAWARRVYISSRAMTGPVGELVRAHRPEVAGLIEALLFEATGGDEGLIALEEGYPNEAVPPAVARAQAAGLAGQMPNSLDTSLFDADQLAEAQSPAPEPGVDPAEQARDRRVARRGRNDRRRYRGGSSRPLDRSTNYRDASDFDWNAFGYLKVWYPRQRMPRVLLPYQADPDDVEASATADMQDVGDAKVFRRDDMAVDPDWEDETP